MTVTTTHSPRTTIRTTSPLRSRPAVRSLLEPQTLTPADLSMVLLVTEERADRPMPTVTVAEIPVSVMPHVIFWSSLYDGFRLTMGATPKAGLNREFQINSGRADQFVDTALRMEAAGADMILLEPAQFTADVLTTLRGVTRAPLFPFSVSGEYTALTRVDSETGQRDVRLLVELFTMLKRAGASASVTYAALDIARQIN
ncbi:MULTISPECIES: hypothetical protein [unclassified Streptomyces]|uniref:hypothetical protein n=1 Tax=unclassified Streptomyces TaxID=2593676 RepID=UPI00081F6BEB|nr:MULTISPECIES: hypothetical protein [unclassified Streptomyces]SCF69511.1 Delta-aminolevulinic acid dehydratase [Streptomyces sp. MnatMP-M17]